jgi:hypothetical protein
VIGSMNGCKNSIGKLGPRRGTTICLDMGLRRGTTLPKDVRVHDGDLWSAYKRTGVHNQIRKNLEDKEGKRAL